MKSENSPKREMTKLTRRGLIWGLAYISGIFGIFRFLDKSPNAKGITQPFRKAQGLNEKLWEKLFSPSRRVPEYSKDRVTPERFNETIGMEEDLDPDSWKLLVEGVHGASKPVIELTMKDILAMPVTEMTTEFFCIEGWSVIQTWKGVLMRDFMNRYPPDTLSGKKPDLVNAAQDLVPYVAMTTPNENYFVGLDMGSVIHAQTMLCYEMNGQPLTEEHGAPLRLVIPVKYGVKNIKRLGKIQYRKDRPADYWAQQGYDWYAGL